MLTAHQLASYRGCWSDNDFECCEAAQNAIDECWRPEELEKAEAWVAEQVWD